MRSAVRATLRLPQRCQPVAWPVSASRRLVEIDAVADEPGEVARRRGAGPTSPAACQVVPPESAALLEQHDVAPAELRQVIRDAGADDAAADRRRPAPGRPRRQLDVIQGEVEDVEVAQPPAGGHPGGGPVQQERHRLLADAAVRAQRGVEAGEIVPGLARADHHVPLGYGDQVAHAVGRQLEAAAGRLARRAPLPSRQPRDLPRAEPASAPSGRYTVAKEPSAPWWHHVGIGDGQDHARGRRRASRRAGLGGR